MKKKKRWPRDEALYVQESEFLNFFEFVRFLTNRVCKNKKMKSIITCMIIWRKFPNLSVRQARGLLLLVNTVCDKIDKDVLIKVYNVPKCANDVCTTVQIIKRDDCSGMDKNSGKIQFCETCRVNAIDLT